MKVSEAFEKVCPFIMGSGSINFDEPLSNNDVTANINCICGDCMAWKITAQRKTLAKDELVVVQEEEGYCKRLAE